MQESDHTSPGSTQPRSTQNNQTAVKKSPRSGKGWQSGAEANLQAQKLCFGPIAFQAASSLRELGLLAKLKAAGAAGITLEDLATGCTLPAYGVRVLLEAGLGLELVRNRQRNGAEYWRLDKIGYLILDDPLTRANFDFVQDICYQGITRLADSVRSGQPEGLGDLEQIPGQEPVTANNLYELLASLPEQTRNSWFNFDHYYSDHAFPEAVKQVLETQPATLLDIGGNTGKWAICCCQADPNIEITIVDLPGQLAVAEQKVMEAGLEKRVSYLNVDLLDESQEISGQYDVLWMSQFLSCFSDADITAILKRCRKALKPGGSLFILEHFWDEQSLPVASYCLQMTSLYFTAIANGTSQMYRGSVFLPCVEAAGFKIVENRNGEQWGHTLLRCQLSDEG